MNTRDRFFNTIQRKPVDHVPVALIGTNRFFAGASGIRLSELLFQPDLMIEAQSKVLQALPEVSFIPGCWPDYGVSILSAFGCKIFWVEDGMPQVRGEIIKNPQDIAALPIPNPQTDGLMPLYLYTLRKFAERKEELQDHLRFVWSFGPGELAGYLCGISPLFLSLVESPGFAKGVLEKATKTIISWINAQLEINPLARGLLLTDDISGMVSRTHYEEYLLPYHKQIRAAFPELAIVFHNDAKSDHILASLTETGFEVFNFGKTTDIIKCRDTISAQMCLMGNLDPLELMVTGSPEEVYEGAKECLRLFPKDQGYILSAGGGLNQGTTLENIRALISAVKDESHE